MSERGDAGFGETAGYGGGSTGAGQTSGAGRAGAGGAPFGTIGGLADGGLADVGPSRAGTLGTAGATGAGDEGVKEKAQQLAGQAREQATQKIESGLQRGKARAADALGGVAQSLVQSSQQLRDQNQGAGQYVEQAAQRLQGLSDYLRNTDVDDIIDRVEMTARRQPALFLGGAFALGVLGARFFKSSRRQQRADLGGYGSVTGGYAGGSSYGRGYVGGSGSSATGGYGAGGNVGATVSGATGGAYPGSIARTEEY
jgi:hypothetical protein